MHSGSHVITRSFAPQDPGSRKPCAFESRGRFGRERRENWTWGEDHLLAANIENQLFALVERRSRQRTVPGFSAQSMDADWLAVNVTPVRGSA